MGGRRIVSNEGKESDPNKVQKREKIKRTENAEGAIIVDKKTSNRVSEY